MKKRQRFGSCCWWRRKSWSRPSPCSFAFRQDGRSLDSGDLGKFPEVNEEPSTRSVVLRSPSLNPSPSSTPLASEKRSLWGSRHYSGVHIIVIAAKENFLTQEQVVICRVNVDSVRGYLAQISSCQVWRSKNEVWWEVWGGNCTTQVRIGYLSRKVNWNCSFLDTSCRW